MIQLLQAPIPRRTALALIWAAMIVGACAQDLVPFYSDLSYQRDEPTDPPWFVSNSGQPSALWHNGAYVSQESGTNDLALPAAWALQPYGVKVGIVDQTAHGDRTAALVATVSPYSELYRHELARWYAGDIAAGILDCSSNGCRVIVVTTGFPAPDDSLSNACCYASNAVLVCATPNQDGDLDNRLVDYPYAWRFPNAVGATSTDRNGGHYSPSATGTNAVGAPGRNIVAAGTYATGTSCAAPILAGCLALLIARYPEQTPAAYIYALRATVSGPARRVDILAALALPAPVMVAGAQGVAVLGLPGWQYELQISPDLQSWQATGETNAPGFYRVRVK